ncbi:PepSY-associated TM helix domain-containing protein [Neptuniibacter sp. QD29_5]|uniref:PepSY-associated TM helix domain-containing protein n=1 Tax=Neptuniibacter sp. QD29_5 TaxID=3398207 RepID=UPI0039F4CAD3
MNQILTQQPNVKTQPKSKSQPKGKSNRLVRWLHSYTSMFMLVIMLFFTVTGITLNHRDWFESADAPKQLSVDMPDSFLVEGIWDTEPLDQANQLRKWLSSEHGIYGNKVSYEWEAEERFLVIDIKRPGGYSIVEADVEAGEVIVEQQNYGVIATLNDLHMGRYSGELWRGFIDISALLMLIFTLTGFWLVIPQKKKRNKLFAMSVIGTGSMALAYVWLLMG